MNRTEILEKLNEVFHDVFDNNDIVVTEQTNANDIEEWDSLIHITLISAVEDEFDVSFDMKTVVSMKNVGEYDQRNRGTDITILMIWLVLRCYTGNDIYIV